nr:hypothetical protein [Tanacetum cinerariifolium]
CIAACSLFSSKRSKLIPKASLFLTISTFAILRVGMPILARITASAPYVNENGVSPLLDLIMVRCAHKMCEISSTQFLFLSPNGALIPSHMLLVALSTRPLAWGCLTEAKHWRILSFSPQSLNGLSLNCFPFSDTISPGRPNLHTVWDCHSVYRWGKVNRLKGCGLVVAEGVAEATDAPTESSGTPSVIKKSPLDFDNENPTSPMTNGKGPEDQAQEIRHLKSCRRSYVRIGATFITPADTKGVNDPDPMSYAEPQPQPEQSMTQSYEIPIENVATMEVQDTRSTKSAGSGKSTSSSSMVGSPREIYQPGWGVTNSYHLDTPKACQDVVDHIVPPGMGSQLRLRFEQEVRLLKKARAQIARRDQRIQVREKEIKKLDQEIQGLQNQTSNLKTLLEAETDMKKAAKTKNADLTKELESLLTGKEWIKAAFEEFKKYEDDRVEKRCADMDARLDALSIDFNDELYPHMLTAIASHRWAIGHGLRLAVMKCTESIELRQAFANVVSAGIAKDMSEGLAHGIKHGKAGRGLEVVEAYDPEANNKYLQALLELKDLKYPIVNQLESLNDGPIEVIMASLYLKSDSMEDAPKDTWAVKEEMLLEEDIAANVSRTEKKKNCQVVFRTHEIGFAHHARSDGVPVSMPTVAPQGLAILLADTATQTDTSEDDASPRLLRSSCYYPCIT